MPSWLNESKFVQDLAKTLLTPKRSYYEESYIKEKVIECNNFNYTNIYVKNRFGEKLKTTVFLTEQESQYCIVYLHGFGSHRLEGTTILSSLPNDFAMCCFDFSGSGKSEGSLSTYGLKESLDINPVLEMLKEKFGFKKFVLWGRSMGAVASLLYTSEQELHDDIIFQVLDSPFCSFEAIARHHASISYKLPEMFIGFGLNILKEHFENNEYNPFKIDLACVVGKCKIPALFAYSEEDRIIPLENTLNIISHMNPKILFERLIIPENHNTFRSKISLERMTEIIKKYTCEMKIKEKIKYKRGLRKVFSNSSTPKSNILNEIRIRKLSGLQKLHYSNYENKIKSVINPESKGLQMSYCFKSCSRVEDD